MFQNYIKIAFRNLIKNKSQTAINVGGLTLGTVCALVIFLVIQFDLSFDKWHEDGDRIYRVVREDSEFGNISHDTGGPYPFAEAVENDVSGLEKVTIVHTNYANTPIISYTENGYTQRKFKEDGIAFVEKEYFDIFTYEWLAGTKESVFTNPNSAVITESLAHKLFGTIDVLGREMIVHRNSPFDFTITGLVRDMPENSDFPFTFLGNVNSKNREGGELGNDNWDGSSSSLQTYVKLLPGVTPEEINAQFDPLIAKYRNQDRADVTEFYLQSLSQIHFDSRFGNYNGRVIEKRTLYAMAIIGFFLLITACINFINLNTAVAVRRSKEVGLRKTLGGTRTQLTYHFLGETAFVTLISILLGVGITELAVKSLEPVLGISPELNLLGNPQILFFLFGLFLSITFAAGWYPARYLSGFSPIEAIRNSITASYGQGLTLRRGLIVIQFTITQFLIIGTIVIAMQINYFNNQELGFEQEAVVHVDIPIRDKTTLQTLKTELLSSSAIQNVTFSNTGTTHGTVWGGNYVLAYDTVRVENEADVKYVDEDFLDTYGIQLLAGSNLQASDTVNAFLVNESLAIQAGFGDNFNDIIGTEIMFWGNQAPVIGVVGDFNTSSLHESIRPVVVATRSNYYISAVRINTAMTSDAISALETAFNASFPDAVFEYTFLDDHIAQMYEDEQRTAQIMNIFTAIAIIIGCLGLFGLISYMATTRTKEIGVRKVLGASIADILKIFGGELGLLTGISFLIAAPASYYFMQQWLSDFEYKISLGFEIFALAFLGTIVIATLTVGYKSVSAAIANPVDSLKSE